jgi:hypothetical protein
MFVLLSVNINVENGELETINSADAWPFWVPSYEAAMEYPEMWDAGCALLCYSWGTDCIIYGEIPMPCPE